MNVSENTAMEDELESAVGEALSGIKDVVNQPQPSSNIRPLPHGRQVSLNDQWSLLEKIDRELRDRIRREKQQITSDYDREVVEIQNIYAEKIGNTVAMLEADKAAALKQLADKTADKLRDHELLSKRMNG